MTLDQLREAVIDGKVKVAKEKVTEVVAAGIPAKDILTNGLIAAMAEVGKRYEEGEYFVPEMLVSARAMKESLAILKPYLISASLKPLGKVAIGTARGDLHDIGKNLVGMMLEGAGFEIMDMGVDVAPEKFLEAVRNGAQVIAMSALLTTTMGNMKSVIDAVKDAGMRDKVTIVVGGAPITAAFAHEIGADGYAPDASQAVHKVRDLLGV